ncbi:unnamed protein product [Phytophthora lilii]|uniref:Unnamed protein product n=1 Tax=Phytophthora lilii TaxID=2077276 RepID=A0A9W6WS64_9STRA|nr:unnamed protein product [Phytophthora lilii]
MVEPPLNAQAFKIPGVTEMVELTHRSLLLIFNLAPMRPSPLLHALLAAALLTATSAIDFGFEYDDDGAQTADFGGTENEDQTSGEDSFQVPALASSSSVRTGCWPQLIGSGDQNLFSHLLTRWNTLSKGLGGDFDWGTLGGDCSGSNEGD